MNYKYITVAFGAMKKITGPALQWQYNEKQHLIIKGLNLPEYYAVDFMNQGDAKTIRMTPTEEGVLIPDQYLLDGRPLIAYIVVIDGESVNTIAQATFPVNTRGEPSDISPKPAEQQQIDSLVSALNDALDEVDEALTKAMPAGGLAGQVLAKKTDDDYDTEWTDQSGGGGGGTTNYNRLTNKPKINGIELTGNQTAEQLGLATPSDIPTDAGDIEYDESATYQAGSVGAELQEHTRQLSDVEENQIPELKNAIDQKQDATSYVTLSGTIVTQTGVDNTMYLCGELAELTFTAPATGQTAIRFTSGTTPTVATFTGVTWLNGFDPTAIEASKTYEINILNGLGCAAWT